MSWASDVERESAEQGAVTLGVLAACILAAGLPAPKGAPEDQVCRRCGHQGPGPCLVNAQGVELYHRERIGL